MSWSPIEPYRYTGHSRALRPACTASISLGRKAAPGGPEQRMRLQLMFRTALVPNHPHWMAIGESCLISAGWGADHGSVRVETGRLYKVARLGGRSDTGAVRIIVPLPQTLLATPRKPVAMQMRQEGEAVIVSFPVEWRAPVATMPQARARVMQAGGRGMFA